jgi:hypothetical protein
MTSEDMPRAHTFEDCGVQVLDSPHLCTPAVSKSPARPRPLSVSTHIRETTGRGPSRCISKTSSALHGSSAPNAVAILCNLLLPRNSVWYHYSQKLVPVMLINKTSATIHKSE